MTCRISRIEYALPESVLSNADLAAIYQDWDAAKIEKKTGVRERRIVAENETSLDLAEAACRKLLEHEDPASVNFLLVCTETPDHLIPPDACLLQDRLGLPERLGALDFNMGCTGFVHGLALAKGLIAGNMAERVLLVAAETYSKLIHPMDRVNRTIFGDGAVAVLVERSPEQGIGNFIFGTDGSLGHALMVPNGGLLHRYDPEAPEKDEGGSVRTDNNIHMNGPEIFNFLIKKVPALFEQTLEANGLAKDDLDMVVFHQANKYMLDYLRTKLGIPADKYHNDILLTGNIVSGSVPLALRQLMDAGRIGGGSRVLVAGFGVGLAWTGTVLVV